MTGFGLGLAVSAKTTGRLSGGWWDKDAVLDVDLGRGRYRFSGQSYRQRPDFLAATGGVETEQGLVFGPQIDPAVPELLINGDFATGDLTGWTPVLNGSSSAQVVAGAARLASDGTPGAGAGGAGISQGFPTITDRPYRACYDIEMATAGLRIGGGEATAIGPAGGTRAPGRYCDTFSADGEAGHLYAYRNGPGTAAIDAVSVRACRPFAGFVQGGVCVAVEAVAQSNGDEAQVLWSAGQQMSADAGDEIAIVMLPDGHVHVQARLGAALVSDLDLGPIADGAPFHVAAGFAPGAFFGRLEGGPIVHGGTGRLAGLAVMRIGARLSGAPWLGDIRRVRVYPGGGETAFLSRIADLIRFEGDSFVSGAHGVMLPDLVSGETGRGCWSTGAGGANMTEIAGRLSGAGYDGIRGRTTIVWQGAAGDLPTTADIEAHCDLLETGLSALGHNRFLLIVPCVGYGVPDLGSILAIKAQMESRWPGHVLDWRDWLTLDDAGLPRADMFADPPEDGVHLSAGAMAAVAVGLAGEIAARGW